MSTPRVLLDWEGTPESWTLSSYLGRDGYKAFEKALKADPVALRDEVKASGLRGRGGAGFPTGLKWSFFPKETSYPKYLVVNADESEPGTFKDRYLMEYNPHQLIEGVLIGCRALYANAAYIYIRGEFDECERKVRAAIREAEEAGWIGDNIKGSGFSCRIYVHKGAGAYICGEETALMESLEGKKGQPRIKPPFPAQVGIFGMPTTVNNVETICAVPWIIRNGGAAYKAIGTEKSPGTKLISASGHINKPGVYEIPLGYPLKDFLENECGGVWKGRALKAVIPGGSSVPVLTAAEALDSNLDYENLIEHGSMLGSGGLMVLDEHTSMVTALRVLAHFYADESCGQCTPCREGTGWTLKVLERIEAGRGSFADLDMLLDTADNMTGRTICVLADALAMPVRSYINKYRAEFEECIRSGVPLAGGGHA
jgi:NADH-quinone oxidoreductase subunit F